MGTEDISQLRPDFDSLAVTSISGMTRVQIWRHMLPHALPRPCILWFLRGHARLIVEGRALGISPNSCVILPAMTAFALEPGSQMQAVLFELPLTPLVPLPEGLHLVKIRDIATQAELSGLLDRISSGLEKGEAGYERAALARAMLVSALLERLTSAETHVSPKTASQKLAARFAEEVEQCYATGASLNDIGTVLDVTPTHLTRTLKTTCGMTAARYLNDRLMHAARSELMDTRLSAADIARDLGFSSPAYFSRAFLHHAGETPGKFRARHQSAIRQPDATSPRMRPFGSA